MEAKTRRAWRAWRARLYVVSFILLAAGGMKGTSASGGRSRVFGMQEDPWQPPNTKVFLRYNMTNKFQHKGGTPWATEMTVCYRTQPSTLAEYESFVSLAQSYANNDVLYLYRRGESYGFYYNGVRQLGFQDFVTPIGLHQWTHYCHVFTSGQYVGYVAGEERARGPIDTNVIPLLLNGTLILGQEQDLVSGAFDVTQIFRGRMAQVNIWSRSLGPQEVAQQAACKDAPLGDVFSSDRDEVEVFGATEGLVESLVFCLKSTSYVLFPEPRLLAEGLLTCRRVGLQVYSPDTPEDNVALHNLSLRFTDTCSSYYHLWIGATDQKQEGVWRKISDNKEIQPQFELGEPNGGEGENCLLMFRHSGLWVDTSCAIKWPACVPCQVNNESPLRLRGLCFKQEAQTYFEVLGYRGRKPYFHGYYGMMMFSQGGGAWQILDTTKNRQVATLSLTSDSLYPIGRHKWTLSTSMCQVAANASVSLSLSICDNSQFTCSNGDCVPRESRCNGRDDCPDLSDEHQCRTVILPRGYQRERPPLNGLPGQPLSIGINVKVRRIMDISDVRRQINVELEFDMAWTDTQPKFLNLKDSLERNQLSRKERELLWRPRLLFPNILNGDVKLLDEHTFVARVGRSLPDDFNGVDMDTEFSGDATTITSRQRFSGSFACSFDLFYYPFDTQRCFVLLQHSVSQNLVEFSCSLTRLTFLEDRDLPSYLITSHRIHVTSFDSNQTSYSLLQVQLELKRRWMMLVVTVFLPTSMLLCIGYSTLFIRVSLLQVRLVVSLTTLLVLYTLFNNTSNGLPDTAYIKMIDIWFLYCISILFVIIIIHVLVEHLDKCGQGSTVRPIISVSPKPVEGSAQAITLRRGEKLLHILRVIVVPATVVTFNTVFWALLLLAPK